MEDARWTDTKKEYEVKADGSQHLVRVTRELDTLRHKDKVDFKYRYFTLLPVLFTVLLFYFQQSAEKKRQKRLFELEAYTNATTSIQTILDKTHFDEQLQTARADLFYKHFPKIKFTNDTKLFKEADTLKHLINYYTSSLKLYDNVEPLVMKTTSDSTTLDSLYSIEMKTYDNLVDVFTYLPDHFKMRPEISRCMDAAKVMQGELNNMLPLLTNKSSDKSRQPILEMTSQMHWSAVYITNRFLKNEIIKRNERLDSIMIKKVQL